MLALETLSENRKLNKIIEEVEDMLRDIKIEELPSWKIATQRGIEQGIEKGIEKGRKIIVLNALKKGLDEDTIMAISGFDIDTIHQLKKEIDEIK